MPVHCTSGPCDLTCALYIVHLVCDLTWWDLPRWFHGNNLTLRDRLTQKVRLEIMLATRWAEFPGMDYSLLLPEQVMSWISTHSEAVLHWLLLGFSLFASQQLGDRRLVPRDLLTFLFRFPRLWDTLLGIPYSRGQRWVIACQASHLLPASIHNK